MGAEEKEEGRREQRTENGPEITGPGGQAERSELGLTVLGRLLSNQRG